jgi:hypothetical protein
MATEEEMTSDVKKAADVTGPLPTKDRLALFLSLLSLLVSVGTLTLNRWDASHEKSTKLARSSYEAYHLGVKFVQTSFAKFDDLDIQQEFDNYAKLSVQPIADRLGLRIDIASLIANHHASKHRNFESEFIKDITRHITAVHGAEIAGKFRLGQSLTSLYLTASTASEVSEENYLNAVEVINEQLNLLEIPKRFPKSAPPLEKITARALIIHGLVQAKLDADQR